MSTKKQRPQWTRAEVEALRAREPVAWGRFLRDYGPKLRFLIGSLCPFALRARGAAAQKEWIEERLHDLLRHLLEKDVLGEFDERRSQLGSYLCLVAARLIISHLRKERGALRFTDLYAAPPESSSKPQRAFAEALASADLVEKLLSRYRAKVSAAAYDDFVLLFLTEVTVTELAAAVGKPAATLHKRKQRIREELRALLKQMEEEDEKGTHEA